jgi:hypothetical protein
VATLRVDPRPTPAERADDRSAVEVEEALTVFAAILEDWAAAQEHWELELREGHESGRWNNVEVRLRYAEREQTSSLSFRLDELEAVGDVVDELVLRFEERDGLAKLARLDAHGLHVDLFHILTFA